MDYNSLLKDLLINFYQQILNLLALQMDLSIDFLLLLLMNFKYINKIRKN